jgi:hypothetical protein
MDFLVVLAFTIPLAIGALGITKIWRQSSDYRLKLLKKDFADLENYAYNLEKEVKSLQNWKNGRERGPQIQENGEWGDIIQMFTGDLAGFVPKKLQPLFEDKELQGALVKKFMDDPERFKPLIKKFLVPKGDKKQEEQIEDAV